MSRWWTLCGVACAAACASDGREALFDPAEAAPTGGPARDLATFRSNDETWIAAAFELDDLVRVYRRTGGWELVVEIPVGAGPRSIAAAPREGGGATLMTADTAGRTLTRIEVMPNGSFVTDETPPDDRAPLRVTSAGVGGAAFFVVRGSEDDAAVERIERGSIGWTGTVVDLPFATLAAPVDRDGDGDLDAAVLRRQRDDVVTLLVGGDGSLEEAGTTPICDEPRAAAAWSSGGVAVACADGVSFVDSDDRPIAHQGNLYDLIADDLDGDGELDLAAPDLAAHAVVVWLDGEPPAVHPVSRGPVALRSADVNADGRVDLVSLAFEARAIDLLLNRLDPEGADL